MQPSTDSAPSRHEQWEDVSLRLPRARMPEAAAEVSLGRLLRLIVQHRTLILGCAAAVLTVVVGVTLLTPRTYTATAQFMPQTRKLSSNLSGLAAQFGVALPGTDPGQSPQFYVDLLESRAILGQVADTVYAGAAGPARPARVARLADWYQVTEPSPARRRDGVIDRLRRDVSARASTGSGIVSLRVRAPDPALARQLAARLLTLLDAFNRETRQTQASAERAFTARRLSEVLSELRLGENRLQLFLEQNRGFRDAPALRLQEDRLRRDLAVQQQVYTTLAQAVEQARIEEVRDTPLLTTVEMPNQPSRPDSRYVVLKAMFSGIFGLLIGLLAALLRDGRAGAATRAAEALPRPTGSAEPGLGVARPWQPGALDAPPAPELQA